jgi:hypothetical protein
MVEDGVVTNRPIAGTRWRGKTAEEDERLAADLLADEKERAEHVMLVDLARNDVGRVSVPGSVQVTELMGIERYSHVMHIVSNVTGTLRPELRPIDALRACFPAGTVSGAPKIRAMEIIAELEPDRRGTVRRGGRLLRLGRRLRDLHRAAHVVHPRRAGERPGRRRDRRRLRPGPRIRRDAEQGGRAAPSGTGRRAGGPARAEGVRA